MNGKCKHFPRTLIGEYIGKGQWKLVRCFIYNSAKEGRIKVPRNFITDGASIPKIFYSIIGTPWNGKYSKAAVIHDYFYKEQPISRKRADYVFYEAMKTLGVPLWKRKAMYWGVRMFGYFVWKKRIKLKNGYASIRN